MATLKTGPAKVKKQPVKKNTKTSSDEAVVVAQRVLKRKKLNTRTHKMSMPEIIEEYHKLLADAQSLAGSVLTQSEPGPDHKTSKTK